MDNISGNESVNQKQLNTESKKPKLLGGCSIIACICVGTGTLTLPAAGAGAWTIWSILTLIGVMAIMISSGCILLEALKAYPYRSSYSTVTKDILGNRVALINNLAVYFVGVILLYAYITVSGLILEEYVSINASVASVLFVSVFSFLIWHSTKWVDRASLVLLLVMVFTFIFSVLGLVKDINVNFLMYHDPSGSQSKYVLSFLPIALAAFGFHHAVSTMRDYYRDEYVAQRALVGGALIALTVYVIWVLSIYGNIERSSFWEINAAGGNVDSLLLAIIEGLQDEALTIVIGSFSSAAILSSFIGVGLGLFDFLADVFKFGNSRIDRTKTWAVTFLPPLICSLLYPMGFLISIGYVAPFAATWTCIIPVLIVRKLRKDSLIGSNTETQPSSSASQYRFAGGNGALFVVFSFGVSIVLIQFLDILELLPRFGVS
ncbi:transposase [Vibrio kyushuensis]|uniref:aromatic amino acid transport family protein n=1 Tax=Vibrio kyushuensis TaxID=2910249 RepID=UPI003D11929D